MKRIKYFKLITALAGILFLASCKKDYLDVNTDPNNPVKVTVDLVLPTALGYTAYNIGNPYQILGGFWGQYWTQGPTGSQFVAYDQYSITSASFDARWINMYSGPLNDLRYIVQEGTVTKQKNYVGIAKIMQAYIFQIMTDLHGDVPFSEALKGGDGVIAPKFDAQKNVYEGLIKLVDEGLALIDVNSASHPGTDDLFFSGDMDKWKRFGNTVKLKIYLRQAYVLPAVAENGIKAMYTAGAKFLDNGGSAEVQFTTTTFNEHPLYAFIKSLGEFNILASRTALDYLNSTNDPRIDVFYLRATAAPNAGNHFGILQGNGRNLPNPATLNDRQFSKPGAAVGGPGGNAAPVIFMSAAESYFLQAEAVARGWGTGNAKQLYDEGVKSSFNRWSLSVAEFNTYIAQAAIQFPAAGTMENKVKAIIFQKWVSMCGTQNVEAWTEWRRTGYPDIFAVSLTSNIGAKFPVRLLYPDSEVSANPNTPPQKPVTEKVWWDVNTTGQN
jgi:hypothetical protein